MKNLSFYSILISFLFLIMLSCDRSATKESSTNEDLNPDFIALTPGQIEMAGIETGKLEKALVADVIDCTGYIDVPPTNKGMLHAPIGGIIQSIAVVPGVKVNKGDILATLADQEIAQLQESFLDQRSNLSFLETELQRKKKLYDQEAISKKSYLSAQNDYNLAKFRYNSLSEQLMLLGISETELIENGISSTISIKAPFHGYISDVFVNIGMYVDENKPMIEILNYDHVHLELSVYSNDISKIKLKQLVRYRYAGTTKGGWGEIQLIGKKVDDVNRSVLVHAHIDETESDLTIGSSIMAEILTNADSVYCLPEEAFISQGDLQFVFINKEEGFMQIPVSIGRSYNGYIEILNPEKVKHERFVTKGAYYLAE